LTNGVFDNVFICLVGTAVLKNITLIWLSKKHTLGQSLSKTKTRAGKLTRIFVYPVKSLRGISVEHAQCDHAGLMTDESGLRDRCLMICTSSHSFVTARQQPRLVLIEPSLHDNSCLHLDAPGTQTLKLFCGQIVKDGRKVETKIWDSTIEAFDCGDEAAEWIDSFLGKKGFRIVYHSDNMTRRRCDAGPTRWHKNAKTTDKVAFQDGFPFMLMTEPSVQELNSRLQTGKVAEMERFRPNLVVSGCRAFDEDSWNEITIGSAVFYNIKPCQRCVLTTVDTKTGEKDADKEPLKTLRSYRLLEAEFEKSPCFGINLVTVEEGRVSVGDDVWVTVIDNS